MFKEIFTAIILGMFYPDGSFLNELTSMDHMVEYNTINLSEVGADPAVIKDNSVWPLTPLQRTDSGIRIPLATFDTRPTHVTNVEEMETSYDKCASVLKQHGDTLRAGASRSAAYNLAPATATANLPVLETTGAVNVSGFKALTWEDITNLSLKFDALDYSQDGRVIVLNPMHKMDLKNADMKLYKAMIADNSIDGFKIYTFTGNPYYDTATQTKQPYGSVTGSPSSIAFLKSETMRAMGTIEGEPEKRWADYRGWLIGLQMRFVAMRLRDKGVAAIISV